MARTSIDGLTVRSATTRRPTNHTSTRRVVGGFLVEQPKSRRQHKAMQDVQPAATEDFLGPVAGFGADEPEIDSLVAGNEVDWSDLLDGLDHDEKTTGKKSTSRKELGVRDDPLPDQEQPDTPKKKRSKRSAKSAKKKLRPRKVVAWVLLAILVLGGGAFYLWGDALISRLTNGNSGLWDTVMSMMSDTVPFETDANGRTNVLVFGTEGYDMDGSADGGGTHDGSQLTDSIMVISFDQKTKDVALLSLPRDLKVSMACSAGKINEVFMCHNQNGKDETAGAEALMAQVGEILDIDFQYWAHVNWGSVVDIVDSIGGITVTLDEDINDRYYTGMIIKAGVPTQLTGIQAVALARARHGTQGGDFTRGNSQQKIVEGIARKLTDEGIDWTKALNLLNILGDNLRTNFSSDNIKAGVHLVSGFDIANIRQVPLVDYDNSVYYVATSNINGISYVVPNNPTYSYNDIQAYVKKMFSSNPAVREEANIAIYNATDTIGVAGNERDQLESEGYTVITVGDAASEDCSEHYCVFALSDNAPATKAALENKYGVTAKTASELPADIRAAQADFVVIVGQTETSVE